MIALIDLFPAGPTWICVSWDSRFGSRQACRLMKIFCHAREPSRALWAICLLRIIIGTETPLPPHTCRSRIIDIAPTVRHQY